MKIVAAIERGHLTNQLNKLARVMGQTITEVVKGQARLVARDCIKRTPPFTGKPYKPNTESFASQFKAGEKAIRQDILRVFRPANSFWSLTLDRSGNKGDIAKAAAKAARAGDLEAFKRLKIKSPALQKIKAIQRSATLAAYDETRSRSKGRPSPRFPGILIHKGTVPAWEQRDGKKGVTSYGGIAAIYKAKVAMIGLGKAGWLKALEGLGGTSKMSARWINRHSGKASGSGILKWSGKDTTKPSVTAGNAVPHVQQAGQERRIIENALRDRMRNLPKQIEAAVRAQKRAKTIGIK